MSDLIKVFDDISSDDQIKRENGNKIISEIVNDKNLYLALFSLLGQEDYQNGIYVCASGLLKLWLNKLVKNTK